MLKIVKAYITQMSYEVSDTEKIKAEQALLHFDAALKALNLASDHLNIMKTPFKENSDMTPDAIMQSRAAMRRYRDKVIDNFNKFKIISFKCINFMQSFSSDTQSVKLMKSFIASIDDLEVKVNKFIDLFNDLQSKDFSTKVVQGIESVQKTCSSIDEIIDERIKNHIQTNILAKNWVDAVSSDLQMKIEKQTPLILDLFNKRQDQLNEIIRDKNQG